MSLLVQIQKLSNICQRKVLDNSSSRVQCIQKTRTGFKGRVVVAYTKTNQQEQQQALMIKKFKAHNAALTAALIVEEEKDYLQLVSAGLDNSLTSWYVEGGCEVDSATQLSRCTIQLSRGGPVFSLQRDQLRSNGKQQVLLCGTAAKQVVAWEPPAQNFINKVVMGEHTGWVRSLASSGRWLYSCGCNYVRQWDLTWAVPRQVRQIALYTGDVLALVAEGDRLVACGADGSLRTWQVDRNGDFTKEVKCDKAHDGRVTGAVLHKGLLYTIGFDGVLRAWCPESLECILDVKYAHDGKRIYCITIGPDGILYTGGDDALIRRWTSEILTPHGSPLYCHSRSVRVLASGKLGGSYLVSGDSGGKVAVWKVV
eukprot:TRINITY_DN1563_c0_g1_i1.p1 TRINITY_DN1563_c0_g1~~TRINITY_DN1563_c0_g1_i1.p1  ORF type:complete len:369 (-),score=40.24 TRINITY_DN1563_c0_g1_i1:435-1541(-)